VKLTVGTKKAMMFDATAESDGVISYAQTAKYQ